MKKYLLFIFLLLLPLNVEAKDQFIIKCDQATFKEFEDFACRTNVETVFEFNKITFELELSKGISLDEVRSNFTGLWEISADKNLITAKTKNNILVSELQEFGILLLSTMDYGEQRIKIKNITLTNSIDNTTQSLENAETEIKILSSENQLKNIYLNSEAISKFNSEIYTYKVNIDNNIEKIEITADLINENSKITGVGEIKIEANNPVTVVPITVKSETGITRIYYLYLVKEIIDTNLTADSIELTDSKKNLIDFEFNPNIYEYQIEVDSNITSLNLNVMLSDSLSLVKDYGNRKIDIHDGDNAVLIKIKNKDNEVRTYVLNITKLLSNKSANFYLKTLEIDKYELKFSKKVKVYYLPIKKSTKKLNINATAEDKKATVNIIGNEDLKEGSIVKILVKAENGSKFTYQIHIKCLKHNIFKTILFIALLLSLIGLIYIGYKKYYLAKKKKQRATKKKSTGVKKPKKKTKKKTTNRKKAKKKRKKSKKTVSKKSN
ncbi:MAG: cadherin-like beta sandwich domain-containing protein [Mollicutes bacterium]|nr:cadherin-like beta sandwich domain-containing protein [Mollicutes bacterium]